MLRENYSRSDVDPAETRDWLESLDAVWRAGGAARVNFLLAEMHDWTGRHGVHVPFSANTPYVNTIHHKDEPVYPGDREIERRIKSYVRWNAMAMVVRANKAATGIGGHISSFASSATLYEVGYHHFFRGKDGEFPGDQVFIQGHTTPGTYARAFLLGRLDEQHLVNFRRELAAGGGLSSYPHPWLQPDFWQFPTVSMGLGPITSIYQARFNRYLHDRGLADTENSRVWAFLGDGEMDEPESLGAITLASRERLDNLTWVVNCNLQRLDGPVRGNGSIIQGTRGGLPRRRLERHKGPMGHRLGPAIRCAIPRAMLADAMDETRSTASSSATRSSPPPTHASTSSAARPESWPNSSSNMSGSRTFEHLRLGGHDPEKVYAAFAVGRRPSRHQPTVILVRTIKGYGMGEAGEGRNITHSAEEAERGRAAPLPRSLRRARSPTSRWPRPRSAASKKEHAEYEYLHGTPGGARRLSCQAAQGDWSQAADQAPSADIFDEFYVGSEGRCGGHDDGVCAHARPAAARSRTSAS